MSAAERTIVCAIRWQTEDEWEFNDRLHELLGLCQAGGADVVATFTQERNETHRGLYLGTGKILEVADAVAAEEVDLAVFDGELSPAQIRNLESRLAVRVIDRTQLILDIFATRAQTHEGRLQVEIAQLQYLLPRLTGRGIRMSRLGGGIGTRGPGETKLETDRRRIRERVSHLRGKLKAIRKQRTTQRRQRQSSMPVVALVGYTNAGKTTFLERWTRDKGGRTTDSGQERLFDTLQPVARRVRAGTTGALIVLDTVGFVQNLPHLLVESFRATLEEVNMADVIVQVVDSTGDVHRRLDTTYQVLREIGALDKPVITFFNKVDLNKASGGSDTPLPDTSAIASIFGSAKTGLGMTSLYDQVDKALGLDSVRVQVVGNAVSEDFWRTVLSMGKVVETESLPDDFVQLTLEMERRRQDRFSALMEQHRKDARGTNGLCGLSVGNAEQQYEGDATEADISNDDSHLNVNGTEHVDSAQGERDSHG
jgi:GTP-binding protein HflX